MHRPAPHHPYVDETALVEQLVLRDVAVGLGQRQVVDGPAADGCSDTTGIEAVSANLGPDFPAGIFVCRDGDNTAPGPAGNQNFKYVRLENLINAASLPA